ncbi:MAG: hypothetical protein Q9210_005101 [Variospora velana]
MPIPQNPQVGLLETTEPPEFPSFNIIEPNSSEGSIKTEICDGPLSPAASWNVAETENTRPRIAEEHRSGGGVCTSDRNELIERIKRGESPTWIPSQTLQEEYSKTHDDRHPSSPPKPAQFESTPLLPAAEVHRSGNTDDHECTAELSPPSEIKRPRSALHSGDFNRGTQYVPPASQLIPFTHQPGSPSTPDILGTSPPISWPDNAKESGAVTKLVFIELRTQSSNYAFGGTGRRDTKVDDEPSPYVGHIDLQQLPTPAESKKTHRSRSKSPPHTSNFPVVNNTPPERNASQADQSTRRHEKRRRASSGPSGLQGGYRIPREGQLQIVIKNPNKTAVKLFLVPYNLEDMEAGSKTFIRQRCYSADPVIDAMPSNSAEREFSSSGNAGKSKPTLRYLIHVNICSPSNGRFYLYQHIRVVFANRVPDNKEQLQTEIHVPQPRYSAYNPKFPLSRSISGSGARLMKNKVHKRHSSGFSVGLEAMGGENFQTFKNDTGSPVLLDSPPARTPPVASIPFHLTSRRVMDSESGPQADFMDKLCGIPTLGTKEASELPVLGNSTMSACSATPFDCSTIQRQWTCADQHESGGPAGCEPMDMDMQFSPSSLTNETDRPLSPSTGDTDGIYGKVSKRGARYAGQPLRPQPGEGLLARKLKGLGMQKENREEFLRLMSTNEVVFSPSRQDYFMNSAQPVPPSAVTENGRGARPKLA